MKARDGIPDGRTELVEGAGPTDVQARAEPADREYDPFVGQILGGRYRVIERLAIGGMGTVYRAEHLGLRKEVALKLVNDGAGARSDHALRFLREAMLTSRIDHPNVISATDYGTFDDSTPYLAMSLVNGPTLASVMEAEQPMQWVRAAEIGAQIADAVSAAQAQGIVHRDLKPENLVLQPMPDGREVVKVLDFGIAKYVRDSLAPPSVQDAQQATRVGVVVGTPGYMAPEQALGMRADHRADLYAIGVVLWECVVGRKLWVGFKDLQHQLAIQLNKKPSSIRIESADASIPEAFEALVASLLATRPEDRPKSAADVRDVLRALVLEGKEDTASASAAASVRLVMTAPHSAIETGAIVAAAFRGPTAAQDAPGPIGADIPIAELLQPRAGAISVKASSAATLPGYRSLPTVPSPLVEAPAVPPRDRERPPMRRLSTRLGLLAVALVVALLAVGVWPASRSSPAHVWPARPASISARELTAPLTSPTPPPLAPSPAPPEPAELGPPPASTSTAAAAAPAQNVQPSRTPQAATRNRTRAAPAAPENAPTDQAAGQLRAAARIAFGTGDFRASASLYRQATNKAPRHAGAHAGLGASLLALGDAPGAIAAYRRATELSPARSGFHAALGRAYLMSGDRGRAVAAYRKAVALDPINLAAFTALAQLAP